MKQPVYSIVKPGAYKLHNTIKLVNGGSEYFDQMVKLIQKAKFSIHLQVYIYDEDATGMQIAEALMDACRRGVKTYLLVDGYASQKLSNSFIENMKNAGVYFHQFAPLFRSKKFYFGRRLHHKILVVDSTEALVGGINISDKYNNRPNTLPWLDMALYVKGASMQELEYICCETWNSVVSKPKVYPIFNQIYNEDEKRIAAVRVRRNDWVKGKSQIWKSYAELLANSHKELIVVCSYFLPGTIFRKLLSQATKKGVNVCVMMAGPSDVMLAKHAERYLYRWMLRHNIKIYEYTKSILHAKVALSDNKRMTIGSYNINNISAYASIELNLDVRNKPFVKQVANQLKELIKTDCVEITYENYRTSYNRIRRIWQHICYEIIKVILFISTFYFKQERTY